jgi:hypothetical protein
VVRGEKFFVTPCKRHSATLACEKCCRYTTNEINIYRLCRAGYQRRIAAVVHANWESALDRKRTDQRLREFTPTLRTALDAAENAAADYLAILDEVPQINQRGDHQALCELLAVASKTRRSLPSSKPPGLLGREPLGIDNPKLPSAEQRVALAYAAVRLSGGTLGVNKDGTGRLLTYIEVLAPYLLQGMDIPQGRALARIRTDVDDHIANAEVLADLLNSRPAKSDQKRRAR